MEFTCETIGLTEKELQNRVVDGICDRLMLSTYLDEDGEFTGSSELAQKLNQQIRNYIDNKIDEMAEQHVLPNVSEYIESITLQETNKWGEKRGEPCSFIEYLAQRAEAYLNEKVDHSGVSKNDGGFAWSGKQTRITYFVHKHLQHSIDTAMKGAVKTVNDSLAESLTETARIKLSEISSALKVDVKTR